MTRPRALGFRHHPREARTDGRFAIDDFLQDALALGFVEERPLQCIDRPGPASFRKPGRSG
ncbi:MAG: hypothetical protein I4O48_15290 [Ralstonia sp.]|nr:hypothetical protein [Ralstonia sp.]